MKSIEKFHSEQFVGDSHKEAFQKATKWVALNITAKHDSEDLLVKILKDKEASLPTITVEIYAEYDDKDWKHSFCTACKDFHKSFYINQQFNCSRCNMVAYRDSIHQKQLIKTKYKKQKLEYNKAKSE